MSDEKEKVFEWQFEEHRVLALVVQLRRQASEDKAAIVAGVCK